MNTREERIREQFHIKPMKKNDRFGYMAYWSVYIPHDQEDIIIDKFNEIMNHIQEEYCLKSSELETGCVYEKINIDAPTQYDIDNFFEAYPRKEVWVYVGQRKKIYYVSQLCHTLFDEDEWLLKFSPITTEEEEKDWMKVPMIFHVFLHGLNERFVEAGIPYFPRMRKVV